jgi:hypothetical protein
MKDKGVPLSKIYERLKEIAASRPSYKIIGGPFEIIELKKTNNPE